MKISVVIPTYNRRDTLAGCLATVFDQDLPPDQYEVVVVVDGSTDGTIEMLASSRHQGARLIVVEQENRGQTAALNTGVRAAQGDIVLFLDDDLLCDRGLLSAHASAHASAATSGAPSLVFGQMQAPHEGQLSFAERCNFEESEQVCTRFLDDPLPKWPHDALMGPHCSIPQAVFLESGGYDEKSFPRRGEDRDLGLRLWKMGVTFRFEPRAVTSHRWVKPDRRFLDDLKHDGASIVALCRKHPELRPHFGYAGVASAPVWKRYTARAAASRPGLATLGVVVSMLEKLPLSKWAQRPGMRLFLVHRNLAMLAGALREAGSWPLLMQLFGPRLPVLLYHHIGLPSADAGSVSRTVTPAKFERQVRWLRRRGYTGITPRQWLEWRSIGSPIPGKPILLTFDDAYADVAEYALPVLKKHGFAGAVFVITGSAGAGIAWEDMPVMAMDQVRQWANEGIEIGGHSRTHPDLTTVPDAALADEVEGSKGDLIGAGVTPLSFAYPYGRYDDRVRASVEGVFPLAFTCDEGMNDLRTDPLLLRRTMVQPRDTLLDIELRAAFGWSALTSNPIRSRLRLRSRFLGVVRRGQHLLH